MNTITTGHTASTAFADTGLAPLTLHSYTVAAIDGAGNASAQTGAQVVTPREPHGSSTVKLRKHSVVWWIGVVFLILWLGTGVVACFASIAIYG
jgi:hypothetical protein